MRNKFQEKGERKIQKELAKTLKHLRKWSRKLSKIARGNTTAPARTGPLSEEHRRSIQALGERIAETAKSYANTHACMRAQDSEGREREALEAMTPPDLPEWLRDALRLGQTEPADRANRPEWEENPWDRAKGKLAIIAMGFRNRSAEARGAWVYEETLGIHIESPTNGGLANWEGPERLMLQFHGKVPGHQTQLSAGIKAKRIRISGNPKEAGDEDGRKALWTPWGGGSGREGGNRLRLWSEVGEAIEELIQCPDRESCWIHFPGILDHAYRAACKNRLRRTREILQEYEKQLRGNPLHGDRVTRVAQCGIPDKWLTVHAVRVFAETERRTQFAEHHPEQIADLLHRDANIQEIAEFVERVDQNALKRDPLSPGSRKQQKNEKTCEAYVLMKDVERNREAELQKRPIRERLIRGFGQQKFQAFYKRTPEDSLRLIDSMTQACMDYQRKNGSRQVKGQDEDQSLFHEALVGKVFSNIPLHEALLEIKHPFWRGQGTHQFVQLEECMHNLARTLQELHPANQRQAIHEIEEQVQASITKDNCGPGRIRKWVEGWHAIQNQSWKRLVTSQGIRTWDEPYGWQEWCKHENGGKRHPGLQPITDSEFLQALADANRHCIGSYLERSEYHIFTHPMRGRKPIAQAEPCAILTMQCLQDGEFKIHYNLAEWNRTIHKGHPSWLAAEALQSFLNRKKFLEERRWEGGRREISKNRTLSLEEKRERIRGHYESHLRPILPGQMQKLFKTALAKA